jgi:hypothetical protein
MIDPRLDYINGRIARKVADGALALGLSIQNEVDNNKKIAIQI